MLRKQGGNQEAVRIDVVLVAQSGRQQKTLAALASLLVKNGLYVKTFFGDEASVENCQDIKRACDVATTVVVGFTENTLVSAESLAVEYMLDARRANRPNNRLVLHGLPPEDFLNRHWFLQALPHANLVLVDTPSAAVEIKRLAPKVTTSVVSFELVRDAALSRQLLGTKDSSMVVAVMANHQQLKETLLLESITAAASTLDRSMYLLLVCPPAQRQFAEVYTAALGNIRGRVCVGLDLLSAADVLIAVGFSYLTHAVYYSRPTICVVPIAEKDAFVGPEAQAVIDGAAKQVLWEHGRGTIELVQAISDLRGDVAGGTQSVAQGSRYPTFTGAAALADFATWALRRRLFVPSTAG